MPGAWQMPQGGIDAGETPRQAALRELREETGTASAAIVAEASEWLSYELPPPLLGKALRGRYRGQTMKWFAMRFSGRDDDIDIHGVAEPEFEALALDEGGRHRRFRRALQARHLCPRVRGFRPSARLSGPTATSMGRLG